MRRRSSPIRRLTTAPRPQHRRRAASRVERGAPRVETRGERSPRPGSASLREGGRAAAQAGAPRPYPGGRSLPAWVIKCRSRPCRRGAKRSMQGILPHVSRARYSIQYPELHARRASPLRVIEVIARRSATEVSSVCSASTRLVRTVANPLDVAGHARGVAVLFASMVTFSSCCVELVGRQCL